MTEWSLLPMTILNMKDQVVWPEKEKKFDNKTKKELDDVKIIIQNTMCEFHNYDFTKYINNYKRYLEFIAERECSIESWQTNVSYPLVSSVVDTMFSNIFDFWYEFWITESKLKKACIESFDFRWHWKQALKEAAKECLITWKAYTRDYIYKKEEKQKILWHNISTEVKMPSMEYVSIFDVMFDKSKWINRSPFRILRTFCTWDEILSKIMPLYLWEWNDEKKIKDQILSLLEKMKDDWWNKFSQFDYNAVKHLTWSVQLMKSYVDRDKLKSWQWYNLPQMKSKSWWNDWYWMWSTWSWWEEQVQEFKNNYFLSKEKATYELVEYITKNKKYIYANWNLIWMWSREYNMWNIREIQFSNVPWTSNANGISDNLGWLQDIQNMLWNSFLDNIKLTLWPVFKVSWNLPIWKSWKLDFKSFKVFRTNWQSDIEKIPLWTTDFAPINFMQAVQTTAETRSWVNEYILWWQWRAERVAWGIDLIFNQYKSKLTPITDSIDQMMADISRSWILMYLEHFSEAELNKMDIKVEKIMDEKEKEVVSFMINDKDVKDIINEKNISFRYNSLDKLQKENQRKTLQDVFQFIIQYAWDKVNIQELLKGIMWKDFDYDKIVNFVQEPREDLSQDEIEDEVNQFIWWQSREEEWSQEETLLNQLEEIV